jgi:glutathione S-transferase
VRHVTKSMMWAYPKQFVSIEEKPLPIVLYFAPMSTASITQAVLAELGVGYDAIELNIDTGETRTSEFLALNPNGRVPTLVHDGVPIWESAAITMYLGELFGVEKGLYPKLGPKRGIAMKWVVWASVCLAEAAGRLSAALPVGADGAVQVGSVDFIPEAKRDPSVRLKAISDVTAALAILDGALTQEDYLAGSYSIADTHLFGFIGWIGGMGIDLGQFKHLSAWLDKCSARPVLAALMAD